MKLAWMSLGLLLVGIVGTGSASADGKALLQCEVSNGEAGLEDLSLLASGQSGLYRLVITVSGPGDYMETYHYVVRKQGDSDYVSVVPGHVSLSLNHLTAFGPKSSQLYPGERFDYDVKCLGGKSK